MTNKTPKQEPSPTDSAFPTKASNKTEPEQAIVEQLPPCDPAAMSPTTLTQEVTVAQSAGNPTAVSAVTLENPPPESSSPVSKEALARVVKVPLQNTDDHYTKAFPTRRQDITSEPTVPGQTLTAPPEEIPPLEKYLPQRVI